MKKTKDSNKKGIPELRKALNSATSSDELKIFTKIEARLQENQLGVDCWKIAQQLLNEGQDPLKILSFGKRALNIFLKSNENGDSLGLGIHISSGGIASILHLLGSACFDLKRFNESLSYLNWSERNLSKLFFDNKYGEIFLMDCLHNTHFELSRVKKTMGNWKEVLFHLKKVLEIREKMKKKGCIEIGEANKDVSDAYLELLNYEEALPHALKALEVYKEHLSDDSEELTMVRMSLRHIYSGLGEYDKALEQNRLCLSGFKSMGKTFHLLMAELAGGQILVDLGRCEEAIEALKSILSQADTAGHQGVRATVFMIMAKAFCRQEKYADARKYIKIALRILEKKRLGPGAIATGYMEMAKLYEEMKEYEVAISLVQKVLNIPELLQDYFVDCSLRLFSLVSLTGTEKKRLSTLKEVLEKLKEKFGLEHCYVGYGYEKLGLVYMTLGRPEMAAELFVRAKDIFNVSLGLHHLDSLRASQALSVVYVSMKSYDLADENQDMVTEAFTGLGLSEQDGANSAVQILNRIKERYW